MVHTHIHANIYMHNLIEEKTRYHTGGGVLRVSVYYFGKVESDFNLKRARTRKLSKPSAIHYDDG